MKLQNITFKEKSTHGTPMFPLQVYSQIDASGNYSVSHHWHNEVEILYFKRGEFTVSLDLDTHKVYSGECIILNSEQLHSITTNIGEPTLHHAVVFDMNMLSGAVYDFCQNKYLDPLLEQSLKFPMKVDTKAQWGAMCLNEIEAIINAYNIKYPGWQLSIKASLYKFLSILVVENKLITNNSNIQLASDYKINLVKNAISYIHENYRSEIYIDEMASRINLSTKYFCKVFKAVTGNSPIDYINQFRIEQAAKTIKTEDFKVLEVCHSVGFDNLSYFIKKFKEYKGCTPFQYKKTFY